jgi:hypothetical protein
VRSVTGLRRATPSPADAVPAPTTRAAFDRYKEFS